MTALNPKPRWLGATVVCIAGGPSLSDEQLHMIGRARAVGTVKVIGVNDAYRRAPWIDVLWACDLLWWKWHHAKVRELGLSCELWTCDSESARRFNLQRMRAANREGLGTYQVHTGGNGGYQAVNLAWLWGAARILLVGYDMQRAPDGRKHWFGEHPPQLCQVMLFPEWLHRFDDMAVDIKKAGRGQVINCSPGSALKCFPSGHLASELAACAVGGAG